MWYVREITLVSAILKRSLASTFVWCFCFATRNRVTCMVQQCETCMRFLLLSLNIKPVWHKPLACTEQLADRDLVLPQPAHNQTVLWTLSNNFFSGITTAAPGNVPSGFSVVPGAKLASALLLFSSIASDISTLYSKLLLPSRVRPASGHYGVIYIIYIYIY